MSSLIHIHFGFLKLLKDQTQVDGQVTLYFAIIESESEENVRGNLVNS